MGIFSSVSYWIDLLAATIRMTTPLLLVALGALYSERAGIINLGLEVVMAFSSLVGYLASYFSGSIGLGLVCGILGGMLLNLVFAFFTITIKANQVINGMAMNILASALANFLFRATLGISTQVPISSTMADMPIPLLSDIPFIGQALFVQKPIVYAAFLLVPITVFFFQNLKFGLNYRSVGENPAASESLGINVMRVRYLSCMICGALAGLGGTYLTVCYLGTYVEGIVSGRGFVALSAVIFGGWNPVGIMLATLLFGFADAFQLRLQIARPDMPYQLMAMLPYVITVVALVTIRGKSAGPKASGKPYFREQR